MHAADLRQGLLQLSEQHGLAPEQRDSLFALAGLDAEPSGLRERLPRALGLLAALLFGLGVVMWVAANWSDWSRAARFALLQGLWVAALIAAWRRPRAAPPLGLVALLLQGGLLAYFGQTYQTGADPWQLFAFWALMTLPLACALRSDWVWTPWTLVATLGILIWAHDHGGHRFELDDSNFRVQLFACLALATLLPALAQRAWTGAGPWALRAQAAWTSWLVLAWGLGGLFGHEVGAPFAWSAIFLAAGLAWAWREADIVQMALFALALDVWLVAALSHLLMHDRHHGDPTLVLLLIGLTAAGLVTLTVKLLMRRAKEIA